MLGVPGRDPRIAFYSPLSDAYVGKGTSNLGPADSGQDWVMVANGANTRLSVISEKLTNTASAASVAAGYVTAGLGIRILRIGGRWTFSNVASPGSGSAVFAIWKTLLTNVNDIPDTGFHLAIVKTGWALSAWQTEITDTIASGSFGTPLATDGTTVHTMNTTISGTTATITFPDESVVPVTDARISSLAGSWACFEVFQNNAATETKAAFTEVWAST